MLEVEGRLMELGLELPVVPQPMAEYMPAKRVGGPVCLSSQLEISKRVLFAAGLKEV